MDLYFGSSLRVKLDSNSVSAVSVKLLVGTWVNVYKNCPQTEFPNTLFSCGEGKKRGKKKGKKNFAECGSAHKATILRSITV
jgi:hypothetical protein